MAEEIELTKRLTQDIVDRYYKQSVKMACHLKCLMNFDLVGFIEDMNYLKNVCQVLDNEGIPYEVKKDKTMIWLNSLSQPIQNFFKTQKVS